ncbi:sulfite exporter TauE/SafE family protein [Curvivirga aplysinae]|uniref:sulfite exporter TauE/SafE family protein n=1 Tax=Curvivirga aplysinae TaxID=2529852 RepID=UPI0012BCF937|nr:sulfite exporter TauE/SafE family protein [Curvivirga aplysinae]MTI11072.1 sulfite exporter TauE/SafE family protein [Curvivirga aplysinae]
MEGLLTAETLYLALGMLACGAVAGVLAGLLGVGGGIVIVPVLYTTLGFLNIDPDIQMHIAVGTSLATIIPTSISSSRAHHKRGAVDFSLIKIWAISIVIGAIIGIAVAGQVKSPTLTAVFAVIALIVALNMLTNPNGKAIWQSLPDKLVAQPIAAAVGGFSVLMGIGGGTLSVPILTLFNFPIHRAVGTAALFGLLISLPGTIGFIYNGWGHPSLPAASLGYVNLIGLALISPVTMLFAPLGAKIAHSISKKALRIAFGIFLLLTSIRMFSGKLF